MFVIGKRDMEADAVSVRVHGKGNLGAWPRAEIIADFVGGRGPECLGLTGRLYFTYSSLHFTSKKVIPCVA